MALARVVAARLEVVICLPAAGPFARVQGPGVDVRIFVVDDWSGFPRLSDRGEYDELAWVGWEQAETLRLADPRLLVLVKAALTTPEDYPRADARGHHLRTMFYADAQFMTRFGVEHAVSGYGSTEAAGVSHRHRWHISDDIPPDASRYGDPRHDQP